MNDELVADGFQRHFLIGLIAAGLEQFDTATALQLGEQGAVIINIWPVGVGGIGLCGRGVLGDENTLGDAPIRSVRRPTGAFATLDIFRPVAFYPGRHEKIRRDRIPAARGRFRHAFRERRDGRHHDRRMGSLQGTRNETLTDIPDQALLHRNVPVFALQIIRRFAGPNRQNLIDGFQKHRVAVGFEVAKNFGVGQQPAWADAEYKSPVEHVIEHRDRGSERSRMRIRHVDRAGAQLDLFGRRGEPRDKGDARRDVLGPVGDVLPDIGLGEAQLVRKQKRFTVFLEGQPPILVDRMDRHRKEPELHGLHLPTGRLFVWQGTCVVRNMMTSPKSN